MEAVAQAFVYSIHYLHSESGEEDGVGLEQAFTVIALAGVPLPSPEQRGLSQSWGLSY